MVESYIKPNIYIIYYTNIFVCQVYGEQITCKNGSDHSLIYINTRDKRKCSIGSKVKLIFEKSNRIPKIKSVLKTLDY